MAATKPKPKPVFVAVIGFTLEDDTRIEPGDVFTDPPRWAIEQNKVTIKGGK